MKLGTKILVAVLGTVIALPVGALLFQAVATFIDARRFPPPGEIVEFESGLRLHVACAGPRTARPTIVIETGAGNWSLHWRGIQDRLSRRGRVCAHDRPGYGWSDDDAAPAQTGAARSAQLRAALREAGESGPYVLVGHSYGGYLARLFRGRFPGHVAGLVLVESAHEHQWQEIPGLRAFVMGQVPAMLERAGQMARFGLLRAFGVRAPDPLPDPRDREIADAAARTSRFYATFRAEIEGTEQIAAEVARLPGLGNAPLLVVSAGESVAPYCGDHVGLPCDEMKRAWDRLQSDLAGLSTNTRQVVVPDATHAINIDGADAVAAAIDAFVTELSSVREGSGGREAP